MLNALYGLVLSASGTPTIDWSDIIKPESFSGLINGITTVLPIVIPIGIMIAGIPVIIKLVKKNMK